MKRICKYCGKTYEGDPGSSACPECVGERKKTTIRETPGRVAVCLRQGKAGVSVTVSKEQERKVRDER